VNALAIIDRHRHERRNHQDPDECDLVGRSHDAIGVDKIVGRLIRSRQRAHPSGFPSMSLGSRRLHSVKRQSLVGV
jgi:hypothetical protein